MLRFRRLLSLLLLVPCWSCATGSSSQPPHLAAATPSSVQAQANDNTARIQSLWRERSQNGAPLDFPIGPGDVLDLDVPGLEELEDREVRVAADGTIRLPLLGVIPVAGLTQRELSDDLGRRLEESVMYDPSVVLFVKEYRSRIVSVIGAVAKPGFYSLSSETETILDAVAQAGGLTEHAAQRLYLIPASAAAGPSRSATAPAMPGSGAEELRHQDPILLDLSQISEGRDAVYLNLPVRPGDVITVPERGRVLVKGWVKTPGGYDVTSDLSVLGAISAAGGPRFAADKSAVKLVRIDEQLGTVVYSFDLEKLQRGEQIDIPMQSGDVLDVSHSATRWALWGAYDFTTRVLGLGKGI
jgi:polysaccharide export outer membrane protein